MFFAWGSRRKAALVGDAGIRDCTACEKPASFTSMIEYTARHIYWLFRWTTNRTEYLQCGNCGAAHPTQGRSFGAANAIPFWDRRGWMVGLGIIAAVIALGAVAVAADHRNDTGYIAAPQVGDRYEADLAKLQRNPEAARMYGVLRVTRIGASDVEVELSKGYYDKWRGVDRDVSSGAAKRGDYYGTERIAFPRAAIKKMFDEGVIRDVDR